MLASYGTHTRRTIEALARLYGADRFALTDEEVRQLVAHSQAYYRTLPLRFRFAVALTLALFRLTSWMVSPRLRAFTAKSPSEQAAVYERWCSGPSYVTNLLVQVLHLSFLGSLYSLPRVQAAIGYQRVMSLKGLE